MADEQGTDDASSGGNAEFAQAFKDLAKGERTASALESHLTSLESKIDALLASVDKQGNDKPFITENGKSSSKDSSQKDE